VLHKNHIHLHFCCHLCHSRPSTYIHSTNKAYKNMKIRTCIYHWDFSAGSYTHKNNKNAMAKLNYHPYVLKVTYTLLLHTGLCGLMTVCVCIQATFIAHSMATLHLTYSELSVV
jgi:hypothetical protein